MGELYLKTMQRPEQGIAVYKDLIAQSTESAEAAEAYYRIGSHYFRSKFYIEDIKTDNRNHRDGNVESLQSRKQINLSNYDIINKRQLLRCKDLLTDRKKIH